MSTSENFPCPPGDTSEKQFYSAYEWALDPILSLRELFERLQETLNDFEKYELPWQREECKTNLYLFVSAITCTVDDYLGQTPPNVLRISERIPRFRVLLLAAQKLINVVHFARTFTRKSRVAFWRRNWASSVDAVCDLLIHEANTTAEQWGRCKDSIEKAIASRLPKELLDRRMQLPSGFRSQDLAHQDAISLATLFDASQKDRQRQVLIIGPRSMGAYFASPLKAKLKALGWTSVTWCTLRPKKGISRWEEPGLREIHSPNVQVLVVDESPNTGNTFLLMVKLLREMGVPAERIFLLAAMHPTRPDWRLPADKPEVQGVTLIRLEAHDLHKNHLLEPAAALPLLADYFRAEGWSGAEIIRNRQTDELNVQLAEHFQDGFQCRLKRVFNVQLKSSSGGLIDKRILAKSVGWGWLGYHAYFAGMRLGGFVPCTLGLRNGLLFTEYLEEASQEPKNIPSNPPADRLASYVAARVKELRLPRDPCFEISIGYGWTGWRVLIDTLKRAYGRYIGRLKVSPLHRSLEEFVSPVPTLIDGKMRPEDWIRTEDGFRKTDFEHHNFGRTELYIVDPAYDLASAAFEFQLSPHEEQQLIERYVAASGDEAARGRILLWKLVHGTVVTDQATTAIATEKRDEVLRQWNRRQFLARNFLVHHMNRFAGSLLPPLPAVEWTKHLFFMDLDGVFDSEVFGFPQTTSSGLLSLAILRSHGFSVVLNTARSVLDVQQYCEAYSLPGGVAESGCVFVDAVRKTEVPIADAESVEQLKRCREAIQTLPGVFVDTNYKFAVRAFRPSRRLTEGLRETELRSLLDDKFDRLTFISTYADSTILPKGIGKGPGLLWAKRHLGMEGRPVVAIGDNDQDIEMLRAAETAYAPANSSRIIRELAAQGHCRMTRRPFQRGLLEAVRHVVHPNDRTCDNCRVRLSRGEGCGSLVQKLMGIADRPRALQFLAALNWRGL
jgi:hydroxymethylpyrimidine pyrophosphatase-like HAD family hydrolase